MTNFSGLTPRIRRRLSLSALLLTALLALGACSTTPPEGVTVVTPFDVNRYLGKWYEVARLDHAFERGMSNVSAQYSLQPDGSIKVINRGFSSEKNRWNEAVGRAVFTGEPNRASLKVSFFGPFYGGYHVIALDQQNYQWAMVVGPNRDYVWILARDKELPMAVQVELLTQARQLGIAVDALIWVDQTRVDG